MRGEQPENMNKQLRIILIFKRKAPKSAKPRAFARFAEWLIRSCLCVLGSFILARVTGQYIVHLKVSLNGNCSLDQCRAKPA